MGRWRNELIGYLLLIFTVICALYHNLHTYTSLVENGQPAHKPIGTSAEVFVINAALARIHWHQRVPHHILEEWPNVDLAKDEPKRVAGRVTEHDKLEARNGLEEVQTVC